MNLIDSCYNHQFHVTCLFYVFVLCDYHQYHGVLVRFRCSCGDTFTCNCLILVLNKVYYYYYYSLADDGTDIVHFRPMAAGRGEIWAVVTTHTIKKSSVKPRLQFSCPWNRTIACQFTRCCLQPTTALR